MPLKVYISPVLQVDIAHGHSRDWDFYRDIFPVYDMAYRRPVFWKVTASIVFATHALADGIVILILAVAGDYCVLWSLDTEDMLRYWHDV